MIRIVLILSFCVMISCVAAAPSSSPTLPVGTPLPPPIARPADIPFPGLIQLRVDATDIDHRVFQVHERIPARGGTRMTLLYPAWMPGNHAPRGPLQNLGGLRMSVDGQPVEWVRDEVNMSAFHVDLPQGATFLDIEFQFLSPTTPDQGRVVLTPEMVDLQWNTVILYPAGHFARHIDIQAAVKLPPAWSFATALELANDSPDEKLFQPTSLETLIDSPVFAGRYFRTFVLDSARRPVRLNVVADSPDLLDARREYIDAHRNIVRQVDRLFGSRPFDSYDFLLALSDRLSTIGLEHQRSSENAVRPGYFSDWDDLPSTRFLLAHEYVHAWNGKYRRPADLWTPDFNTPMRDSLLWVYEGLTQYWELVVSARAGMLTTGQARQALAVTAAVYDNRPGRSWRSLADTMNKPILTSRRPLPWPDWQRWVIDFYDESALIWLDVDTLIRELSAGRKSLDDFARLFFGGCNGDCITRLYTFDDVIEALNSIQANDWRGYFLARIRRHAAPPPLDGLARGGYRLVYSDQPSAWWQALESLEERTDLTYSIGLALDSEGAVTAVRWNGPAFSAGMTIGATLIAVNGIAYDAARLKRAIQAARGSGKSIDLLARVRNVYRTYRVRCDAGLRYPHLERITSAAARLDDILAPK